MNPLSSISNVCQILNSMIYNYLEMRLVIDMVDYDAGNRSDLIHIRTIYKP